MKKATESSSIYHKKVNLHKKAKISGGQPKIGLKTTERGTKCLDQQKDADRSTQENKLEEQLKKQKKANISKKKAKRQS